MGLTDYLRHHTLNGMLSDLKYWIIHRTIDKYHIVKCDGLKPGYYDSDVRMFAAAFGLLKDYVEVELAHNYLWMTDQKLPLIHRIPLLRHFFEYRKPEQGLAFLKLDESNPLHKEIEQLYFWYMNTYKSRPDALYLCGYFDLIKQSSLGDEIDENRFRGACSLCADIEDAHSYVDTEMLIRLVKIRSSLWT